MIDRFRSAHLLTFALKHEKSELGPNRGVAERSDQRGVRGGSEAVQGGDVHQRQRVLRQRRLLPSPDHRRGPQTPPLQQLQAPLLPLLWPGRARGLANGRPHLGQLGGPCPVEVLIDAFVALYRLKCDNDAFKVCLAKQPHNAAQIGLPPYPLILIIALYRIAIQVPSPTALQQRNRIRVPLFYVFCGVYGSSKVFQTLFENTLLKHC